MVPLYAARIADLGPDDISLVECGCGHTEELTAAMRATAGVFQHTKVLDLPCRLKCRECQWRGRAAVSVRWA
jgi:hypothetical protein